MQSKQIELLINLKNQQEMTNEEFVQALQEVGAKLNKAAGEIVSKITALELALNNQVHGISKEAELELNALKLAAQRLDDIVPDVTVEPVAEEETPSEETPTTPVVSTPVETETETDVQTETPLGEQIDGGSEIEE